LGWSIVNPLAATITVTMSAISITRQSDFIGRLVLDQKTAEELGRVAELWLNPKKHQIIGLSCKAGLLGTQRRSFTWSQIETIGDDSIIVSALDGVNAEKPEGAIGLIAQDVWTDSGSQIGGLIDYRFDAETGDVIDYVFVFNGWRSIADSGYCLPPGAVISMNNKRLIVAEAATQNPERFTGRLDQGIASIKDFLKADLARTQQDVQTIATRLQGFTQKTTAQFKGSLSNVTEQLQASPDPKPEFDRQLDNPNNQLDAVIVDKTILQDQTIAPSDVEDPNVEDPIADRLRAELIIDPEPINPKPINPEPIDPEPVDPEPINPEPTEPK
jgi:sporulation protein YlmC with PRC-barrel domain